MLKERLKKVSQLIEEDSLIDIGTDHGYLIIDLLKSNKIKKALAVEITKGPLQNVENNVRNHRLNDKVDCALSDGLTKVDKSVVDKYKAISICGMGGSLIAKILTDSKQKLDGQILYLQPNNGEYALRKTLIELGYKIVEEDVLIDNDIFYEVIKAVPGSQTLSEAEMFLGPINMQSQGEQFLNKCKEKYRHTSQINTQLLEKGIENPKLLTELSMLKGALDETI